VIVDALGNLIRFVLLPGQRHDITSFDALMAGIYCLALIGDKGLMPAGCAKICFRSRMSRICSR